MPNTLTTIFTSTPATEPVESPHPNTGAYVLGTQLGNGTWQVVHTLVTKTSTPPTITGRLKNFPAVAASVVASGNVFNNILATPTGLSAVASSASAINATVSSNANATAYRLLSSATAGGTYAQIYQGAAASFAHTGLTAGTTYYYEWQYVGGGYYDDSLLSTVFSGIASANYFPAKLHFGGDSITAGAVATSWVEYLKPALNATNYPTAGYNNIAVSGECADQQLARVQTQIIAVKGTGGGTYQQDIAVLFVGVNDLRIGDTTAQSPGALHAGLYRTKDQIAHDILEWGRQCRLNGIKPILKTFGADRRLNVSNPTEDTRMVNLMIAVNNIITANATKFGFVGVIDSTADSFIGTPSSPITYAGSYYTNDLIHPSVQGQQYIESKIQPVLELVAATALTAFTDPGQYVAAASTTGTGQGTSAYTPYALAAVDWTGFIHATLSGTSITGVGARGTGTGGVDVPADYWGGANSISYAGPTANQVIAYTEYGVNSKSTEALFGWNNNETANDYSDLLFAWHLKSTVGGIRPFGYGDPSLPNGTNQTGYIPYAEGDVLRITLEQTRVVWYQNGIQRFAVALSTPPANMFIDMSIVPGGVVSDIRLGAANLIARATPANSLWVLLHNTTATGSQVQSAGTSGTNAFDAIAVTNQSIVGSTGTGTLGKVVYTNNIGKDKLFGLSNARTANGVFAEILYAMYANPAGAVRVFIAGTSKYQSAGGNVVTTSDTFTITVLTSSIQFYYNSALVWTEPRSETGNLFATVGMQADPATPTSIQYTLTAQTLAASGY